jgi:hypothetical protein
MRQWGERGKENERGEKIKRRGRDNWREREKIKIKGEEETIGDRERDKILKGRGRDSERVRGIKVKLEYVRK